MSSSSSTAWRRTGRRRLRRGRSRSTRRRATRARSRTSGGDGAGILGHALEHATAAQSSSQLEGVKLQTAANAEAFGAATLATQQIFQQQVAADEATWERQRLDDRADAGRRRDERVEPAELRREANDRRFDATDVATAKDTLEQSLQKPAFWVLVRLLAPELRAFSVLQDSGARPSRLRPVSSRLPPTRS